MKKLYPAPLLLLLLSALLLSSVSCSSEDEVSSVVAMGEVKESINSMSAKDFKETSEITEYVKITVRDHGDIIIRLHGDVAPLTVANFQRLVSEGYYNGLTFHRIYKGLMIQGGKGAASATVKGEFSANGVANHLSHVRGIISMARAHGYDSASTEFFICDADATFLDDNYAAFGYVLAGLDTVDSIASVKVRAQADMGNEMSDPVEDVIIEKACFVNPA